MSDLDNVKKLREETGISLMECKKACEEAGGDIEVAKEILRKRGQVMAAKKSERITGEGRIASYIHQNGKIGVLLDVRCESDFVAKSEDFQNLLKEICLQIAAMNPMFVKADDIPADVLEKEKLIFIEQAKNSGKPNDIIEKMVQGKVDNYKKEVSLMLQPWIKDDSKTIDEIVKECIAKTGENITIARFTRYSL
ncbi:MAG TPA: translation elongation factor Ts [Candidatus Pacearchaeota archaeon]|nr:translation elongation factor Ts [Candidatus Pacearchaeota archaeon]